jgi:hypothetical protein
MEKIAAGNVLPEKPEVNPPMKTAMPPTALAIKPIQNKILMITGVIIRSKLKNRFILFLPPEKCEFSEISAA